MLIFSSRSSQSSRKRGLIVFIRKEASENRTLENFTLSGIAADINFGTFKILVIFIVALFVMDCIKIVPYKP